ncbi:MAG: hypothetical protein ABSG68_24305, partial [Thermoguttaceae bacterium]
MKARAVFRKRPLPAAEAGKRGAGTVKRGATKRAPRAVGTGTQTLGGALEDPDADGTLSGAPWPSVAKAMRKSLAEKLQRIYDLPVPAHVGAFCADMLAILGSPAGAPSREQIQQAMGYVEQYLREPGPQVLADRAADIRGARAAAAGLLENRETGTVDREATARPTPHAPRPTLDAPPPTPHA